MKLKFAHLADLHLGAYREKRLTKLNFETFRMAIDMVIENKVDFVIFAGDIFNNAMPSIDLVEQVVLEFMRLKEINIPIYVIGGSHDYSDSGKSFLSLLDSADIISDISKYKLIGKNKYNLNLFENSSLKLRIGGISGKRRELEKKVYKNLEKINLNDDYFNVFVFHTTLDDLKPSTMKYKSEIIRDVLPKGFDYYAGGHIHVPAISTYGFGKVSYSGALFPNNFSELKTEIPGFNFCEFDFENRNLKIDRVEINSYDREYIKIEIDNLNSIEAKVKIEEEIEKFDVRDKIILLEISGVLNGKVSEIGINKIIDKLYDLGAFVVLKNTYKLRNVVLEIVDIDSNEDILDIENKIIESILEVSNGDNFNLVKNVLKQDFSKIEGEKIAQYEQRVIDIFNKILENKS